MTFDTRLKLSWVLTLLALAVLAGASLPKEAAGVLVLLRAFSSAAIWLKGHILARVSNARLKREKPV